MKPIIKEVSREEFDNLFIVEMKAAKAKADKHLSPHNPIRAAWWISSESGSPFGYPCRYTTEPDIITGICPITGNEFKKVSLPQTFSRYLKPGVKRVNHASDVTCPNISMRNMVRCYANVKDKYYVCEHRVGRCPWKTTEA